MMNCDIFCHFTMLKILLYLSQNITKFATKRAVVRNPTMAKMSFKPTVTKLFTFIFKLSFEFHFGSREQGTWYTESVIV